MRYVSTRGKAPELAFDDVLLAGLADDGGLYVPRSWPQFTPDEIKAMKGLPYADMAFRVMAPFVGDTVAKDDLARIIKDAYQNFDAPEIAPLKKLGHNEWLVELFHGPTLAFKDFALQFLGRMFDHVLNRRGRRITVLGATSGDTGSAAIEACRDRDCIEIFILHPAGRVSDVQRRQMTTVGSANVHNIAVEGTFDDCQAMMKDAFNDPDFRKSHHLSTVNSINWCRIMAQIVYYFWAVVELGPDEGDFAFSVPTGNFGNVFSGYAAKSMGLPISKLVVGSNSNDILTRFFLSGAMETAEVHPTLSPSMDIQISSNFERLLYFMFDRDTVKVAEKMDIFKRTGKFSVDSECLDNILAIFSSQRYDDDETRATIRAVYEQSGELIDPHSAIGVAAGREMLKDFAGTRISLATAHPAKFPDAIEDVTGIRPELPPRLADLHQRKEYFDTIAPDMGILRDFIDARMAERNA